MQKDLRSKRFPLLERIERISQRGEVKEITIPSFNKSFSFNKMSFEEEPVIEVKPKNFTRLGLLKDRKCR